jgi:polyhydroxyalkanoate synthesis regulator phasin
MSTPEDPYRRTPHQDDQYTREQQAAGVPPYDPDAEPATQGDVKSLRRWLIAAAVWAVAASVIALIALIDDDTGGNGDGDAPSSRAITRVEQRLDRRIDELEQRVENAPSSDELDELSNRIGEVEGQVEELGSPASEDDIDELNGRIEELEQRVEELENQPPPEDAP